MVRLSAVVCGVVPVDNLSCPFGHSFWSPGPFVVSLRRFAWTRRTSAPTSVGPRRTTRFTWYGSAGLSARPSDPLSVLPSAHPSVCVRVPVRLPVRPVLSPSAPAPVCVSVRPVLSSSVSQSARPLVCLCVRVPVRPSSRPSARPSLPPSARLFVCPSTRPSVRPPARLFVCPSVRPHVYLCDHVPFRPVLSPSVRPFVRPSILLSVFNPSRPTPGGVVS